MRNVNLWTQKHSELVNFDAYEKSLWREYETELLTKPEGRKYKVPINALSTHMCLTVSGFEAGKPKRSTLEDAIVDRRNERLEMSI